MNILVVVLHLVACIALIAIVLLQTGKGAEMGAAFGGASQTLFGGTGGSSFMSKLTTGAAIVFMITCLLLSYMYRPGAGGRSIMTDMPPIEQQAPAPAPVQPPPAAPEARPVQPEASAPQAIPAQPEAAPQQPAQQDSAKAQPEQGQKKPDKAPAKKP